MKKRIAIMCFFLTGLYLNSQAQFSIGMKGEGRLFWYNLGPQISEGYDAAMAPGFGGGITTETGLGGRFSLLAEVLFQQRGSKISDDLPLDQVLPAQDLRKIVRVTTEKLNYLSFPFLLKIRATGKYGGLYCLGGLSFDFGLSGKRNGTLWYLDNFHQTINSVNFQDRRLDFGSSVFDNYRKFDFSMITGVGFYLTEIGPGRLNIDLRFQLGTKNLAGESALFDLFDPTSEKIKNRSFGISAGYLFDF